MDELLRDLTRVEGGGTLTDSMQSLPRVNAVTSSGTHPLVSRAENEPFASERMTRSGQMPAAAPSHERSSGPPSLPRGEAAPSATPEPMHHSAVELEPPRRSRLGVVLAALLVGGAAAGGVLVWRSRQAPAVDAAASAPQATAAAATAEATAPAAPVERTLRVTTEPDGARVSESGTVHCAETPCEIRWKGDEADRPHRLVITKSGFDKAEVDVAPDDDKIGVKLSRPAAAAAPPPDRPRPTPAPPPPGKSKTLSGYKESPY
jgi:serine/threonine-protein kinase